MICRVGRSPDVLQASVGAWNLSQMAQEEIQCNFWSKDLNFFNFTILKKIFIKNLDPELDLD